KFGIQVHPDCVFCAKNVETFEHLYFGCPDTSRLWEKVLTWTGNARQIGTWPQELQWIYNMAKKKLCRAEMITALFEMVIYCIWRERNSIRFNKGRYCIDELCKEIAIDIHIQG
ncbi:hypothetical protein A4A49_56736, partial [Nicotiana attenuata]